MMEKSKTPEPLYAVFCQRHGWIQHILHTESPRVTLQWASRARSSCWGHDERASESRALTTESLVMRGSSALFYSSISGSSGVESWRWRVCVVFRWPGTWWASGSFWTSGRVTVSWRAWSRMAFVYLSPRPAASRWTWTRWESWRGATIAPPAPAPAPATCSARRCSRSRWASHAWSCALTLAWTPSSTGSAGKTLQLGLRNWTLRCCHCYFGDWGSWPSQVCRGLAVARQREPGTRGVTSCTWTFRVLLRLARLE